MSASGHKASPTWQRNIPSTNLNLPRGLVHGVNDRGTKFQSGPVNSAIKINSAMPLETRTAHELGILSSSARLELYHTFSTDERRVIILRGAMAVRATRASTCSPEVVRKRRPEVITLFQSTTKRPSRFKARVNAPSSLQ